MRGHRPLKVSVRTCSTQIFSKPKPFNIGEGDGQKGRKSGASREGGTISASMIFFLLPPPQGESSNPAKTACVFTFHHPLFALLFLDCPPLLNSMVFLVCSARDEKTILLRFKSGACTAHELQRVFAKTLFFFYCLWRLTPSLEVTGVRIMLTAGRVGEGTVAEENGNEAAD